ncbi:MAG: transposase, partial [Thermoguttaceae bacterium]
RHVVGGRATLPKKLVKIGAKVTRHSRYVTFQLAEVAVTQNLFAAIIDRIARLAIPPPIVACYPG